MAAVTPIIISIQVHGYTLFISKLISELKALQESDGVKLMNAAGATEMDWEFFLKRQRQSLETELAKLESDALIVRSKEAELYE